VPKDVSADTDDENIMPYYELEADAEFWADGIPDTGKKN